MAEKSVVNPLTLRDALQEVIDQNRRVGFLPETFIEVTERGYVDDPVTRCSSLIHSGQALSEVTQGVIKCREFLSLEDLIALSAHGSEWGFHEATMARAKELCEAFNSMRRTLGHTAWVS